MFEGLPMDLDLDLGLVPGLRQGPGRKAKEIVASYSRDLTVADLTMAPAKPSTNPPLKKIRDSHHSLARVLATGMSEGDASIVTGYSPGRISVLKADPQFQDLLTFYRETATEVVADFRARMADMGLEALEELRDRLHEKPDDFSPGLLNELVKTMADRTGHAPQRGPTSVTQINVALGDRMAKARERVGQLAQSSRTIDAE
jgi:hypothetical protein